MTVQSEIDRRLARFFDRRVRSAAKLGPEVREMVSAVAELSRRGGKRLRPALVVLGFRAVRGRGDLSAALDAGVALELLQAYFLIHDDWMDGDRVRRGGPSVHAALSQRLGSERLGAASAILAGDYAQALALDVLSSLELDAASASRVLAAFAEMQLAAVAGQQIDLIGATGNVEAAYELKTGSYTVHGPLKLGAILAGGSPSAFGVLQRVARPLGVGFQLRDDLLSAFGDPRKTGKPLGNDLKAGKRTLLMVEALRRVQGAERKTLTRVFGNPKAKVRDVQRALSVLETSGARAAIETRLATLAGRARRALGPGVTREGRELLHGAIEALTERRA